MASQYSEIIKETSELEIQPWELGDPTSEDMSGDQGYEGDWKPNTKDRIFTKKAADPEPGSVSHPISHIGAVRLILSPPAQTSTAWQKVSTK